MDYSEEMVMMPWKEKGCAFCRKMWETGEQPPRLGMSLARHTYLHQCEMCGSYWEQHERYADTITNEDAKDFYPELVE